jgi:uncharacterized lipoprotein YajG
MNPSLPGPLQRMHGWMQSRPWLWCAAILLLALQGCATNRESASVAADADITKLKSIYVVRSEQDDRGVYITLAEQLRNLGYTVSTGTESNAPVHTDALLSYQAQWQWDMTMYLLDLRVTLRNPTTQAVLGSASSYHTSMTRKSTEEMVAEVLANLRGEKPAATAPSSGPGTAQVQLKPYVALPAERAGIAAARGDVRIGMLVDARRDATGKLIGERTTLGSISLGMIEMQPPPAEALGQLVRAELSSMGFGTTTGEPAASLNGRVTRFVVSTPATALYWDINGAVELQLVAQSRDGRQLEARYAATCTDRTFVFPSAELIGGVVTACLKEIGAKLRKDNALAGLLAAP